MKKSIVWLASFPKSGNTWTRIFLANYLMNSDKPVPINQIHRFAMGDSIPKAYRMAAGREIDTSDMKVTLGLRNKVLRGIVANNADVNFVKTHNIRKPEKFGDLFPEQYTRSAIYIIRNPLDVVVSYARHYGLTHEETVAMFCRSDHANLPDETSVWQFLGSWSEHVKSWTGKSPYPVCILRYEDMLDDPHACFTKMLENVGVPVDQERLDRAIRFSSFDELSQQEKKDGFIEQSRNSKTFFFKGKSGGWKSKLAPELVEKIRRDHRKTMKHYGYL